MFNRIFRRKQKTQLQPLRDHFDVQRDGEDIIRPTDETLDDLAEFLSKHYMFILQMRSMGCQIAISSRLADLLKDRGYPDIDDVLGNVPVIFKRGSERSVKNEGDGSVTCFPEILVAGHPSVVGKAVISHVAVERIELGVSKANAPLTD